MALVEEDRVGGSRGEEVVGMEIKRGFRRLVNGTRDPDAWGLLRVRGLTPEEVVWGEVVG